MALPVISNNTPAAGSIQWTEFNIQYNGQSFTIPAGSTSSKFVWWLYGGGTSPSLQAGNTLPALGADDMILFLNKDGIGALVPTAELVDGSLIVSGSIIAQAIAANAIQTSHISANAVTADLIAANAISTKHLSAGTITADKLSVGTVSDNMVVNGSFEDALSGTLVGWEINAQTNGTIQPVTGQASSGAVSMQMAVTATSGNLRFRQTPQQFMPVSAASGRKYYVAFRAGASTATTSGIYLRCNWYDANKALISSSDVRSNGALTTTFTIYDGQATPPSTAKYLGIEVLFVNMNVISTAYIDEVVVHEVTMAAQIGDGQVSAVKITANTITADRIAAAAITADKILVTDSTNYWENPDFEIDAANAIPKGTTNTNTTNSRVISGGARSSNRALELNALNGSNNDVYATRIFPVEPGDQFYIQYDYKFLNTAGTTGVGAVGFRSYGANKVALNVWGSVQTGPTKLTTWQEGATSAIGIYTVPAGTYFLQPYVSFTNNGETTNRLHVDNITMRRMSGGELIVDGAIYAEKIAANAVIAEKIMANAITADKINSNAVVAEKIAANAIAANHISANAVTADKLEANAINGKTITGATIRTSDGLGARVELDSTGLKAFDTSGNAYLTASDTGLSIDGTVSKTGGTNWLGEEVVVRISDQASSSGTRKIGGVSLEKEGAAYSQFPAVYSDSGIDLVLTAANHSSFLSLSNENANGTAELQGGQGINLFSNDGDVKIGKTYNTDGNLVVAKINGKSMVDTGWQTASLLSNFTHRNDFGWPGVQWRVYNGFFILQGSASNASSWGIGTTIATIPSGYNLSHRVMGSNAYLDSGNNAVSAAAAGSGSINFYVSWPIP